jgi:ribosomal protein S18 acetylase RimI-like enzyme
MSTVTDIYRLFTVGKNKEVFPHIRKDYTERMFNKNKIIGHITDDKVVGVIIWDQYKRSDKRQVGNKFDIQLKQIVVDPSYQHRGIGKFLFKTLETIAVDLKAPNICLSVRESNIVARNFYIKMGMSTVRNIMWNEKGKPLSGLVYVKKIN